MTWEQMAAEWPERKGAAKEQWTVLTERELDLISGHHERLVAALIRHYGISAAQAEKRVTWWLQSLDDSPAYQVAHGSARR